MKKEKWYRPLVSWHRRNKTKQLKKGVMNAIASCKDKIPVLIISYNNGVYVENMLNQLSEFNITPIIIDNNSTDQDTLNILNKARIDNKAYIASSNENLGHMVGFLDPIYTLLPEVFAYTDPDLQFNKNLPKKFLEILSSLTKEYSTYKAGFALDLLPDENFVNTKHHFKRTKPFIWNKVCSIREIESKYWRKKIDNKNYDIYCAKIDTTFAVYRKGDYNGDFFDGIRIAGNFSTTHLPWFPDIDLMNKDERTIYMKGNISTTSVK